jgi:hypothetical protein
MPKPTIHSPSVIEDVVASVGPPAEDDALARLDQQLVLVVEAHAHRVGAVLADQREPVEQLLIGKEIGAAQDGIEADDDGEDCGYTQLHARGGERAQRQHDHAE